MSVASLVRNRRILSVVGDIVEVETRAGGAGAAPRFGDLAMVVGEDGRASTAQVVRLAGARVFLQIFSGAMGVSTRAAVTFLGRPAQAIFAGSVLGRTFNGAGELIDAGPPLTLEPRIEIGGAPANPARRALASRMIRTDVPMIDVFNTMAESQKIPIFSTAGQPYDALLARIGVKTDADIVVFVGLGLSFEAAHLYRTAFVEAGAASRTLMFLNRADDPVVERLIAPDLGLAVAERFAVNEKKRVLVLLSDMTSFADALKQVGIAMERVPANRGYIGDLYSQLARRYERACAFKAGGSVTVMAVTTMPGGDVTHPAPDNTGYITEGQIYLRDGMIDPFGSLSRLKQLVIGKETREDHQQVMNAMIRLYAGAVEAEQKRAMAFELSDHDRRSIAFGDAFRTAFMRVEASMPLERALDAGWAMMAAHFAREELLIKPDILDRFLPAKAV